MPFNTSVYYNNFDLSQLDGVTIQDHNFIDSPSRVLNSSKLARSNKSILTSAEYSNKTITIQGIVCNGSKSDTEAAFETLKGIIVIPEGTLRVEQTGIFIEYVGTLQGIEHEYYGNKLRFTLTFLCSNPIGASQLPFTTLSSSTTDATHTFPITIEGSFRAYPSIVITFTSVTGGTTKNVSILDSHTLLGLKISHTFTTGDILEINADFKTVTLNGALVDYGGTFPSFYPGTRALEYIDDFSARNISIVVTYNKQYA